MDRSFGSMVALAVTLATKQIHVDAPTDQALLRRFASQLSNDGGNGKKS